MDKQIIAHSKLDFIEIVCEQIFKASIKSIRANGVFSLVLSGGNTPKDIFKHLTEYYLKKILWNKTHIFWIDERCVPPDHPESNYKLAKDYLISYIDTIGSVNRIKGEIEHMESVEKYRSRLLDFFNNYNVKNFDFVLLGMGEDGHVGSIFPDSNEFKKKDELVLATNKKHSDNYRITLGIDLINRIENKVLLVNTERKKEILDSEEEVYPINHIINKLILIH